MIPLPSIYRLNHYFWSTSFFHHLVVKSVCFCWQVSIFRLWSPIFLVSVAICIGWTVPRIKFRETYTKKPIFELQHNCFRFSRKRHAATRETPKSGLGRQGRFWDITTSRHKWCVLYKGNHMKKDFVPSRRKSVVVFLLVLFVFCKWSNDVVALVDSLLLFVYSIYTVPRNSQGLTKGGLWTKALIWYKGLKSI